jgi:HEAT repeat protein
MSARGSSLPLLAIALCGLFAERGTSAEAPAPDALIKNLKASDVEVRRAAALTVRNSDRSVQRGALPVLIEMLMKEKDGQVRLAILDAVTMLGRDAEPAVSALVHTLKSDYGGQGREESHQDYRSALALAAIGKPSVEALSGLLKERKENVRAEAAMALGRIGPDAAAAVPALIVVLPDKSERVGHEAANALGRIGKPAVEPLITALANASPTVRARAVESLGLAAPGDGQVRAAVLMGTHDASPEVRAAALRSLPGLALSDNILLPILAEGLANDDERVRMAVVNLVVARRPLLAAMAPDLETLVADKNEGVSRHAAFLLGRLGPEAAARLLKALRDKRTRIEQLAAALAEIGRPVAAQLVRELESAEPRVRRGAALALGQIRPLAPGVVPKLTAGLGDPDRDVRATFLTAVGMLGPRAGEAMPDVRKLLKDEAGAVRLQAIDVLAHSAPRDEQVLADLTPLLSDSDARVQRAVIDTIRPFGPLGKKALGPIVGKLNSADASVRLAAAQFIGAHGSDAAEAVPALTALLADPNPALQTTAAQTLGKLGKAAQPALAKLTPLLASEHVEVREAATGALGSLDLDVNVVRPYLAKALHDEKTDVRRAAMRAIQRFGPQSALFVPDLIVLAADKSNAGLVERSLRRFERRGPEKQSLPELVKLLEHKQESVRLLASKFLGLAGSNAKEAIPALERLREDPSTAVRKQAEAACEQIKNNSAPEQRGGGAARKKAAAN